MITVTLQFPTQEALVAFFNQGAVAPAVAPAPVQKAKPAPKPVAPVETAAVVSEPVATSASPASLPEAEESVPYATLQKAVFTLASASREAASAVLAKLGLKNFKELAADPTAETLVEKSPGAFANAKREVEAALAELKAAA